MSLLHVRTGILTIVTLQTHCQPLTSRSRASGSGRDQSRSSWRTHSCSAPRTFSYISPWILSRAEFVGHARTLCDIGQTCGRYGDAINWIQLVAEARAYQIVKPLYYALRWARELVGADVSSDALKELSGNSGRCP